MNYITEINAFEKRMRQQPLPANAQLLWYKLMAFANRLRWPEWFTIDNDRLAELLNTSLGTTRAARDQLIEAGLIEFRRGVKKHPNQYRLISLIELEGASSYFGFDEKGPNEREPFSEYSYDTGPEDITRYFGFNESTQRELEKITAEIFDQFMPGKKPDAQDMRRVFHLTKEITQNENGDYSISFPHDKKALLCYAFDQASAAGVVNWNYIFGIYRNFYVRNIKSMDDVFEYEIKREGRRD